MVKPPMWDLDQAQILVRNLNIALKTFDVHVALGGGVINRAWSAHDVDLYVLPVFKGRPYQWGVIDSILDELVGPVEEEWANSNQPSSKEGKCFREQVARRTADGKRADVFIVDPRVETVTAFKQAINSAVKGVRIDDEWDAMKDPNLIALMEME